MTITCCLALIAISAGADFPTPKQIASGAANSPKAIVALERSAAKFRSIPVDSQTFKAGTHTFFAIQFKAPSDCADRRMTWGFKRFDFEGWYIVGLDEPINNGFSSFQLEGDYFTQTLPGESLKPGRRYALWFSLTKPQNPPLTYSLTLLKKSDLPDANGPKPKLPNLEAGDINLAWPPFPQASPSGASDVALTDLGKQTVNSMANDPEFELRRRLGKTIPGDLLAVLGTKPKGDLSLNTNPAQSRYTPWDMSQVTFSHKGQSYCAVKFVPTKFEGASSAISFSFAFPTCDAFGFTSGGEDRGTYIVSPPAKAGAPQLISGDLSISGRGGASEPITMWFRYKPASKPTLHLSLNWLPAQIPVMPLLGPRP